MENTYDVRITDYGLKLDFTGPLTDEQWLSWVRLYEERIHEVVKRGKPFGQLVDNRKMTPANSAAQEAIMRVMTLFKQNGGERSAVFFKSSLAAMQIRRLAIESGIIAWEKYFDEETFPDNCEQVCLAWVIDGKDPDA